jgi:hypothetical protein
MQLQPKNDRAQLARASTRSIKTIRVFSRMVVDIESMTMLKSRERKPSPVRRPAPNPSTAPVIRTAGY